MKFDRPTGRCLALVGMLGLSGCAKPAPQPSLPVWAMIADDAPPPPLDEEVPPPRRPHVVWTSGYWYWDDGRYTWVRGSYVAIPGKGWVWQRAGWIKTPRGYRLHSGRWVRRGSEYDLDYLYPAPVRRPAEEYRAVDPAKVDRDPSPSPEAASPATE